MRLGIDARLINQTGVGVYTYNLLYYLQNIVPHDWEVSVFLRPQDANVLRFTNNAFKIVEAPYHWHTVDEQVGFLHLLHKLNLDLVHFTYFSYPMLYTRPFISTIHDLTPILFKTGKASSRSVFEYYPKYFAMQQVIKSAVKKSVGIITPSQAVKDQIISYYQLAPTIQQKINVTREGVSVRIQNTKENKTLAQKYRPGFFLYIGNFYPHKNVERLIDAYAKVNTKRRLLLVGPNDYFSKRVEQRIYDKGLRDTIELVFNPTLEDLVYFYKNAHALIQPSLSEGFGLTPVEALYFSCPVLGSRIDVFSEILGSSYESFDEKSVEDIAHKIRESDEKKKPEINTKLALQNLSFKDMAKKTFEVYNKFVT